jgi:hypothetical protein
MVSGGLPGHASAFLLFRFLRAASTRAEWGPSRDAPGRRLQGHLEREVHCDQVENFSNRFLLFSHRLNRLQCLLRREMGCDAHGETLTIGSQWLQCLLRREVGCDLFQGFRPGVRGRNVFYEASRCPQKAGAGHSLRVHLDGTTAPRHQSSGSLAKHSLKGQPPLLPGVPHARQEDSCVGEAVQGSQLSAPENAGRGM